MDATLNVQNDAQRALLDAEYLPGRQLTICVNEPKPTSSFGSEQPGTPTELSKIKVHITAGLPTNHLGHHLIVVEAPETWLCTFGPTLPVGVAECHGGGAGKETIYHHQATGTMEPGRAREVPGSPETVRQGVAQD
jgi:hypothetical protein